MRPNRINTTCCGETLLTISSRVACKRKSSVSSISSEKSQAFFFAPLELQADKEDINQRIAQRLTDAGIPLVLLDRDICAFPDRSNYDLVGIDNFVTGYRLAEHVLKLGCKRIIFVAKPNSAQTVDLRIVGCPGSHVAAHKVQPLAEWVRLGDPARESLVRELFYSARDDVFVCANDMTAAILMRTLNMLNIRVPHDVRVAGFDDLNYARLLSVPLTTMHQPCRAIGSEAVRAMLERIANPEIPAREILLTAPLVVRHSCGNSLSENTTVPLP